MKRQRTVDESPGIKQPKIEQEVVDLPFPIPLGPTLRLFGFFNLKQLQRMSAVSRSWREIVPMAQYDQLLPELRWYVKNDYLSTSKASRVQTLWEMPIPQRRAHLYEFALRFSILNNYINWDFYSLFLNNYPLLAVIGNFIDLTNVCMVPQEKLEFVLNMSNGVQMLATSEMSIEEVRDSQLEDINKKLINQDAGEDVIREDELVSKSARPMQT